MEKENMDTLKKRFYTNKMILKDGRPLSEKWHGEYNGYWQLIYRQYVRPAYSRYFQGKFQKVVWQKDDVTGKSERKNLYRHHQMKFDSIFNRFYFRMRLLTYQTEKPHGIYSDDPTNSYQQKVHGEFQRRLQGKNISALISQALHEKILELLREQVSAYKEGMQNYFIYSIEQRFNQMEMELEQIEKYVSQFDVRENTLNTIIEIAGQDAEKMFHDFKYQLVEKLLP